MKLYFYLLTTDYKDQNKMSVEECEAEEKPKTYRIVGKVPAEHYCSQIMKNDIGVLKTDVFTLYVILTEPDLKRAKQVFNNYFNGHIAKHQEEITKLKAKMEAVSAF